MNPPVATARRYTGRWIVVALVVSVGLVIGGMYLMLESARTKVKAAQNQTPSSSRTAH